MSSTISSNKKCIPNGGGNYDVKERDDLEVLLENKKFEKCKIDKDIKGLKNKLEIFDKIDDLYGGYIVKINSRDHELLSKGNIKLFRIWQPYNHQEMIIVNAEKGYMTKYSSGGIKRVPYVGWDSSKWTGYSMQLILQD